MQCNETFDLFIRFNTQIFCSGGQHVFADHAVVFLTVHSGQTQKARSPPVFQILEI